MLIAGFLTWWQPSCPSGAGSAECEAAIDALNYDANAFDLTFTGLFPWILLVAIGVLTFLAVTGMWKLPDSLPTPIIFLIAAGFSALMIVIRLFADPFETGLFGNDATERGIGLYLAVVAAALSLIGCVQAYKESGGSLSDLKDMNKMKSQFGGGGSAPPPPGMPPPPPPR